MTARRWGAALAAVALSAGVLALAAPVEAKSAQSEHDRIVAFWTNDKVAKAVPRDFVRTAGGYKPAARPGGGGGGGVSTVDGSSWTAGGAVLKTTGKVLFSMGATYYVCSASVVKDTTSTRSTILTAGHCAYDETGGSFAQNWMFIPDYDSAAVSLDTKGVFCASTTLGCWTASSLVVAGGFATAGGFNDTAIVHDYAFAVVGAGGKANGQLDAVVGGGQVLDCTAVAFGAQTYLFGYPAAGKYNGKDLVYSSGALGFDPLANNTTYRVVSTMTGGSSGGPWLKSFNANTGVGTLMSVNSYGYSGIKAMHGPILNAETQSMFQTAQTASGNTIVP